MYLAFRNLKLNDFRYMDRSRKKNMLTYFFCYTKMSKSLDQAKLGSVVLVSDIAKNHNTQINYQDVIPRI